MTAPLRYRTLWTGFGIVMIFAVIALSLFRIDAPVQVRGLDKLHHLLVYGVMMYWWGMLQPRHRPLWAAAVVALGATLELAQSLTPYRTMDWRDMAFNVTGVILALGLLRTGAAGLLRWLDGQLRDRLDPGSS